MSDAIAGASDEAAAPTGAQRAKGVPAAEDAAQPQDAVEPHDAAQPADGPETGDAAEPEEPAEQLDAAAVEDAPQEVPEPIDAGRGDEWYKADASAGGALESPAGDAAPSETAPVDLTAADRTSAASTPLAVAVARSGGGRRERVQLRSSLTLGVFVIGLLIGAIAWRLVNTPPVPVDTFPSLPIAGEPPVAAVVAQHLAANDAQALSDSLDQEVLDAIRAQLNPLTTLERVTFVNAAAVEDEILSAYVVEGTDNTGARGIVGLILVVRDGAVVAQ